MSIPFHRPMIGQEEIDEVADSLRSGWLTSGPKAKRFEAEFAAYIGGAKHAVSLNSCTAALHLALEALGIEEGDGVIVPTMTFAATAEVVHYLGAVPILVDCREADLNMDHEALADALARADAAGHPAKAIIPVHFGGQMCEMDAISRFASDNHLKMVEDAAHCCPAKYRPDADSEWETVGARSDVSAFSFYANKTITTGEGGMALTDDEAIADRIRIMSLHGLSRDAWKRYTGKGTAHYDIVAPGYKYNLTDIAASIGIHQLAKSDDFHAERERLARLYIEQLKDVEQVRLLDVSSNRVHSWHLFVVRIRQGECPYTRDQVAEKLQEAGIGTSLHWRPLHMHSYYRERNGYRPEEFPVAAAAFEELVTLPLYPGLDDAGVEEVCGELIKIVSGKG